MPRAAVSVRSPPTWTRFVIVATLFADPIPRLGRGGMATVYLARDTKHDRDVAVKVLQPELAAALGLERFHREIGIAAALQHPNILPLYDSGGGQGRDRLL